MFRILEKSFAPIILHQKFYKRSLSDVGPKLIVQQNKKNDGLEIDKKSNELEKIAPFLTTNIDQSKIGVLTEEKTPMFARKLYEETKKINITGFVETGSKDDKCLTNEKHQESKFDPNKIYNEHGKIDSIKNTILKKIPILNQESKTTELLLDNAEKSLEDKNTFNSKNNDKITFDVENILKTEKRSFIKKELCNFTIESKDPVDESIISNSINQKQSELDYLPTEIIKNDEKFETIEESSDLQNEQSDNEKGKNNLIESLSKYVANLEIQEKNAEQKIEPIKIPTLDRILQIIKPIMKENNNENELDNNLCNRIQKPPLPEVNKNTYFTIDNNTGITKIVNGVITDEQSESGFFNLNINEKIIKQHLSADNLENIDKSVKVNPMAPPPHPPTPNPNIPITPNHIHPEKIAPPPNTNIPFPDRNKPNQTPHFPPPKKLDSLTTIKEVDKMQILKIRREEAKLLEEVPGPPSLKFIAKMWNFIPQVGSQLSTTLLNILLDYENYFQWNHALKPSSNLFNKYGSIIHLPGPFGGNVIMLSRPDHIEVLFNAENNSEVHSSLETLENYRVYYKRKYLNNNNIINANKAGITVDWTKLRDKIDFPHIFNTNKLHYKIETTSDEFITKISRERNYRNEVSEKFLNDIKKLFIEIYGNVILRKRFNFLNPFIHAPVNDGIRLFESLDTVTNLLQKYERGIQLWRFVKTPGWRKLMNTYDTIEKILLHYIKVTEVNLLNKNKLLENIDFRVDCDINAEMALIENFLVNDKLNHNEISTILLDMFVIGINSSASALSFILYNLANNPREQRILADEIISILPHRDSYITPDMLNDMVYLRACITESLRLDPPFSYITRRLGKDVLINSYRIPKGTSVIIANKIICHNETNFKNYEKFLPERWLSTKHDNLIHPLSSMPYGYGKRSCLAKNLAEKQLSLIVAKIIRYFIVEYHYGDIKSKSPGFLNMPRKNLKFKFIDRF